MLGFDDGRSRYRQSGQSGTVTAQGATSNVNAREGISGFFSRMFSTTSYTSRPSSSSGYVQPSTSDSGDVGDVVLCQPVEGVACQSMTGANACYPMEGIPCQPVTMVPVPGPQP